MKVKNVIIMLNGMVAVFDENDQQIPELQGSVFDVMNKIKLHTDIDTIFLMDTMEMNVEWYFEKYGIEKRF